MTRRKSKRPTWIRFSGMGFEFAAAVIGFTLVGYWIGRHYDCERNGVLIGAGLGIIGGGYNLIRESLIATRQAERERKEQEAQRNKEETRE